MSDYIILLDPIRGPHLEHKTHKYIKRYWKNGHWNYVYPSAGSSNAQYHKNNYELNMIRYKQTLANMNKLGQDVKKQNEAYDTQLKYLYKESQVLKAQRDDASKRTPKEATQWKDKGYFGQRADERVQKNYQNVMNSYSAKINQNAANSSSIKNQKRTLNATYEKDRNTMASQLAEYGKKAATARKKYVTVNANYETKVKNDIKKWESTPLSKIQTAVHKGIDAIGKLISKWTKKG